MRQKQEFRSVRAPGYGYRLTLLQARSGCLSKPRLGVQGEACHADFWPSQPGSMALLSAQRKRGILTSIGQAWTG